MTPVSLFKCLYAKESENELTRRGGSQKASSLGGTITGTAFFFILFFSSSKFSTEVSVTFKIKK